MSNPLTAKYDKYLGLVSEMSGTLTEDGKVYDVYAKFRLTAVNSIKHEKEGKIGFEVEVLERRGPEFGWPLSADSLFWGEYQIRLTIAKLEELYAQQKMPGKDIK